jgi:hypothetical protein
MIAIKQVELNNKDETEAEKVQMYMQANNNVFSISIYANWLISQEFLCMELRLRTCECDWKRLKIILFFYSVEECKI